MLTLLGQALTQQKQNSKKIHYLQKQAVRIIFNKDRLCHSQPLLKYLNVLNVHQINLY